MDDLVKLAVRLSRLDREAFKREWTQLPPIVRNMLVHECRTRGLL